MFQNRDTSVRTRKPSETSKKSQCQFNLLEDVVTNWRTETLFNTKKVAISDVASSVDRTDIASMSTDTHTDRRRRNSNYTICDEHHWDHNHHLHKLSTASVRPSNSLPLFKKPISIDISPDKPPYSPIEEELTPRAPNTTYFDLHEDDSESSLEVARKLAKISGPQSTLEPEEPIKRKISEVLLGKATVDIRRCSTLSAYVRRPKATKYAMVRRQSLFENFRRSMKKPFGRNGTTSSMPSQNAMRKRSRGLLKFQVGESTSYSSSMSEPSRPESLSLSQQSSSRRQVPPYLKLSQVQNDSIESYFTASSVVINIEPDEGEITPKAPNQT
ncbi:unnamed protein product [Bursaphelenchus okinawaensis]|uniref:Uncharacterized protein n=1 Tax=Bursaphelenchus okinawaensis TaxID=465554 RepID=A0A811KB18_9BILA|nr:unnamed protein product [Bursaphelenchus okinawaensis]CAG9096662.1 unnamed protein product [Bursaphelenchus okinawaensis]